MSGNATDGAGRGRAALVTGPGGSIGGSVRDLLIARGWGVRTLGHRPHPSSDLVADFTSDLEIGQAVETLGHLDGIALCHGVLEPGPFGSVAPAAWRSLLDVNLNSMYSILYAALSKLGSGSSVVIVSSTAAFDHSPVGGPHYTASKWALNGLVRHLAAELGPRGIRVNSVCPGFVDNDMGRAFISPRELRKAVQAIPLARGAEPMEVAEVVAFLLSAQSSYVTGALIPVSGGYR